MCLSTLNRVIVVFASLISFLSIFYTCRDNSSLLHPLVHRCTLRSKVMDYDRYDAFLHHIFKQTQGDAWFRPNEDGVGVSAGVCLRIDNGEFRVFPYENLALEPFETAVAALNPLVAVKVRSAAVHAALADM